MNSKFGKLYPALPGRVNDREKILFMGLAGIFLSLLVLIIVAINFKGTANAKQDLAPVNPKQASAALNSVALFSPVRPIKAGTLINDADFKEVTWPRNQVPVEAVRDLTELRGMYASSDIQPGYPVQRSHLSKEPAMTSLPVTPGLRAVSIEVDAVSGVEGFAVPGTRVDLTLTYRDQGNLTTKVIVQNARVLSYGGDALVGGTTQLPGRGNRQVSKTITLEVNPEDALKIQTARELGKLSLIMRSSEDTKGANVTEYDNHKLSGDSPRAREKSCQMGRIRSGGREYILDCNGGLSEVSSDEP